VGQMNPSEINANASVVRPSRMSVSLPQLLRYGLAVLSIGVAVGTLLLFEQFGWRPPSGMLLLTVVAMNTWYGERGPGLFSIILATFCMDYFLLEPHYTLHVASSDIAYVLSFFALAALISSFSMVRRRVEEDLRNTRDKLRIEVEERSSLLDLTHDSIFVRDMDFVITYWNRGAEEFYGWTQTDAIGKRSDELLHSAFPKLVEIRAQLLETDQWEGELTRTKADGHQVTVASRWSLRRDHQGRPVAILETSNDITARKRWEEEIQGLNQELAQRSIALEASNKELEAFAYSISHDLRAPLRHMAGFAELVRKNAAASLNEKSQRYLAMILEAANRMGSLIDDLLAFSRISRTEARKSTVDLGQVVHEIVGEVRQDTRERNIKWKIDSLPACYGDRSMLRLALVNLISNAVKFTGTRPQGEIEIGCTGQDRGDAVLFVRDNGVGFDMKYSNKLFGVFQRLHPQNAFEGTGIGLATVQRIVHRHGGRVWAESTVDVGTTFYVSLPTITRS
jgi:PAS domain S-box-containing protein